MESIAGNQAARVPRDVARVLRVLVVEDDGEAAEYMRRGLTEGGWTVDLSADGGDGYAMAAFKSW